MLSCRQWRQIVFYTTVIDELSGGMGLGNVIIVGGDFIVTIVDNISSVFRDIVLCLFSLSRSANTIQHG